MKYLLFILLLLSYSSLLSQREIEINTIKDSTNKNIMQFGAVFFDLDSNVTVSYVNVFNKNHRYQFIKSDSEGKISLALRKGDTLIYQRKGVILGQYIVSLNIDTNYFTDTIFVKMDSLSVKRKTEFPWESKEEFAHAFVYQDIPDDDLRVAEENLSYENLKRLARELPKDGGIGYNMAMNRNFYNFDSYKASRTSSLFNPFAWIQFFKALKNGELKLSNDY